MDFGVNKMKKSTDRLSIYAQYFIYQSTNEIISIKFREIIAVRRNAEGLEITMKPKRKKIQYRSEKGLKTHSYYEDKEHFIPYPDAKFLEPKLSEYFPRLIESKPEKTKASFVPEVLIQNEQLSLF